MIPGLPEMKRCGAAGRECCLCQHAAHGGARGGRVGGRGWSEGDVQVGLGYQGYQGMESIGVLTVADVVMQAMSVGEGRRAGRGKGGEARRWAGGPG